MTNTGVPDEERASPHRRLLAVAVDERDRVLVRAIVDDVTGRVVDVWCPVPNLWNSRSHDDALYYAGESLTFLTSSVGGGGYADVEWTIAPTDARSAAPDAAATSERLPWDDPSLAVASDPALRARYRRLQGWYREHVLGAAHGFSGTGPKRRPVGSLLAPGEVARRPALNFFLDHEILEYVDARLPEIRAIGGSAEEHRLRHNMLSSMPMAFSLVAKLRSATDAAAILRTMFGLDVDRVVSVDAEEAPPAAKALLGDRSAFDAIVRYTTRDRRRGVLGIETKYTEPLSQTEYDSEPYRQVTKSSGWFDDGGDELKRRSTNQLWRNAMLAAACEQSGIADVAHVAVIGLAEDASLWKSCARLRSLMRMPDRVVDCTWEQVVDALAPSSLGDFGAEFHRRYLDLAQVGD